MRDGEGTDLTRLEGERRVNGEPVCVANILPIQWLPIREACRTYGLTRSGIDRLRARGILDVRHIPAHGLRVSVASLESLFHQR